MVFEVIVVDKIVCKIRKEVVRVFSIVVKFIKDVKKFY